MTFDDYVHESDWRTAIHESGHAVAAVVLGLDLEYVTIIADPSKESLGLTILKEPLSLKSQESLENGVVFILCGGSAECMYHEAGLKGVKNAEIAKEMVEKLLKSTIERATQDKERIAEIWAQMEEPSAELSEALEQRVTALVEENESTILALAKELFEKRKVSGERASQLVNSLRNLTFD